MLLPCPECRREVSDQARSCPHCGHPIAAVGTERAPVTTQATAKGPKIVQAIGFVLCVAGVVGCVGRVDSSEHMAHAFVAALGVCVYLAGRAVAWWSHG